MNALAADSFTESEFSIAVTGGAWVMTLNGTWVTQQIAATDLRLRTLELPTQGPAIIDLGNIAGLDTAGAWLIHRTELALMERGITVECRSAIPAYARLLDAVRANDAHCPEPPPPINA